MKPSRLVLTLAAATALAATAPAADAAAADGPGTKAAPDGLAESKRAVLDYLARISGKGTVAGVHNREPNAVPALQTNAIHELTGRYPGLWSGDFLFKSDDVNARWAMIYEARKQWESGSLVQLMLHVAPPTLPEGSCPWEGGILSHLTDAQWTDLVTDGGALNKVWKSRLDEYATYLQYLQDYGVPVLFRPHHEMNQVRFWWGGRPGKDGTGRLYRLSHDYLVKTKGLSNLIWVWDMQDMSRDFAEYDPGREYWDVFAFDVYDKGYEQSWYDYILPIVGERPMAIGECAVLPNASVLAAQPRWVFFMSWAELTFTSNGPQQIKDLYGLPNVITRERLPRFGR
jgi:mannan endo-1,4-beta-mannosidase